MFIFLAEGEAHLITMIHKIVIASYRFKKRIRSVKFSPDGKYIAFCKENNGMSIGYGFQKELFKLCMK